MRYRFRALAADGRLIRGETSATGLAELDGELQRRGLELLAASPGSRWRPRRNTAWPRRELIDFCFHLEQLCRAGVPLFDALADLQAASSDPRGRQALAAVATAVAGGSPLSQALAAAPAALPGHVVPLIRAGESSGCLPEILHRLGEALRDDDELHAQGRRALIYPAFVAASVLAALSFLTIFLLPQLRQFVAGSGQALPLHARLLFTAADAVAADWPLLLAALAGLLLAGKLALRYDARCRSRLEHLKLRLPVYGNLLKKADLARFAGTLALLYGAGIPVLAALDDSAAVIGNSVLRSAVAEVARRIASGSAPSKAFAASALFPPLLIRMLHVGENTGRLDEALHHVAHFYRRDVAEAAARVRSLAEPVLTLLLGLLLGWIVLAALGPIYDVIGRLA